MALAANYYKKSLRHACVFAEREDELTKSKNTTRVENTSVQLSQKEPLSLPGHEVCNTV